MKCFQNQSSESSGNGRTTREKGGRDPPNVSLNHIADDLLSYIGGSPHLKETEKEIEKKYDIKREHDGSWTEDDIKRAWGKTQRLNETSLKRKRWALAIILQVMKRSPTFEGVNRKAEQSDQKKAGDSSCAEESMDNTSDQIQSGQNTVGSKESASTYIRIPLSDMFRNESVEGRKGKGSTTYKLIDRLPSCPEIKKRKSYVVLYNRETRNATWVYEILNKSTLANVVSGNKNEEHNKNIKYEEDDNGSPLYQKVQSMEDFEESDYEHGHLAAAANHRWCQKAHDDTYFLSNIAPQTSHLNREMEKLEDQWRKKILNENKIKNVHTYTGPLYIRDEKRNSETLKIWNKKVVPTHFFKVMIVENEDGTVEEPKCYQLPNVKPEDSQPEDKNKQSKDKNNKSKDKNKQSKNKSKQSKDESNQSKDKNNENDRDRYIVKINEIEFNSGLKFTESGCTEGEIDSTRTGTLLGEYVNGEPRCAKIKVRISTPHSDYNDFVYI